MPRQRTTTATTTGSAARGARTPGLFARTALASLLTAGIALAMTSPLAAAGVQREQIERRAAQADSQVIAWRRDFHQHPELSNREFRTARVVAEALEALGLEVQRQIAHTGVTAVLRGARPGPVVALRADMDGLPVTEQVDLPFASKQRTEYQGAEVGVMHACGHDAHTAILLGAAQVLSGMREQLRGTVLFVFQPAEEGAPSGEQGGAKLMLAEGALDDPRPDAIFGLHVVPQHEAGTLAYRSGGAMASSDRLRIVVRGRQSHAAYPWLGVDPIAVASRIVLALQSIPARQLDARIASIVSFGVIRGGVRGNIIPDEVELLGTLRALDPALRERLHERVRSTAEKLAESFDASAEVEIELGNPITYNDPALTARMLPTLRRVAGGEQLIEALPRTGAEDFSLYAQQIPGLYFWLGIRPKGTAPAEAASNHSPHFFVDESALGLGVRAMSNLAVDFLENDTSSGTMRQTRID